MLLSCFRDVATLQAGMGDKIACFIQWVSCFFVGAIVCLIEGWQLTLVILSVAPVAALSGAVVSRVNTDVIKYMHYVIDFFENFFNFAQLLQSIATKETEAYGLAGAVAEEVLQAIRIVAAYAGEEKEVHR